ncbi:MAG: STAS domain-containing protein [SAR324 cluster bacterium]|nr:STAS domain-containing protein [SAR324 cluster bacterium]
MALIIEITQQTDPNVPILHLVGKFLEEDIKHFRNEIQVFLDDKTIAGIVLDYSDLQYIDSSGVGTMISIYHQLSRRGARLALFGLNKDLLEMFEMVLMLDKILAIFSTEQDAINYIATGK